MRARVLDVQQLTSEEPAVGMVIARTSIRVEILDGPFAGQVLDVENASTGHPAYDLEFKPGDRVLVWAEVVDGEISVAHVADFTRDRYLYGLVAAFLFLLMLVGGFKGVKTVVTLGITGLAIGTVLLPLLLRGYNPIGVTVLVCTVVITLTFIVIAGPGRKTLAAIIGTTGGVLVAGLLALLVGTLTRLTGFGGSEEAIGLLYIPQEIDFDIRGLLFAGIIIGALGAIMDVGMSIASAMEEVKRANPQITTRELFQSGMRVGRDIMGTMANTLILAYTGATIPLMLLFMAYEIPALKIINLDMIATEIIRAMAGSIGLILAIPITALVAGFLMTGQGLDE
ncbi:MAG: YibE/F family protein, partial [Clostridia bacterium]|nr:YibE/F family protein [Clostridia bacterium]